jgi:hypothetical protein
MGRAGVCRPPFQLIQRLQRLARAECIRVDGGQGGSTALGSGCTARRRREQIDLGLVRGGALLQLRQRAVDDGGGHAGQARHLDAVAAAGGARLQLVQEDDVVAVLGRATCTLKAAWCVAGNSVSSK